MTIDDRILKGPLRGHPIPPERLEAVRYEQGLEYARQVFARLANAAMQETDEFKRPSESADCHPGQLDV